jgi:hypothetical protein
MEMLFIITRPELATWWARAIIVAVAASAVLNICPRLPWLRDIKASRINARWVGYAGLTAALAVWMAFWGDWTVFCAWVIIAVTTLLPNTLAHWRAESTDGGDRDTQPQIILLPMEKCEEVLGHLVDPRRNLTVALEELNSVGLKARQIAERMPDRTSGQMWFVSISESLDEAEKRIEQTRDEYVGLWEAVSKAWHTFDGIRKQWGLTLNTT